jgi:Ni,Fe-hydrogenase I small subunit
MRGSSKYGHRIGESCRRIKFFVPMQITTKIGEDERAGSVRWELPYLHVELG